MGRRGPAIANKPAPVRATPRCFESRGELLGWYGAHIQSGENATVCDDCDPAGKRALQAQGLCDEAVWQQVLFVRRRGEPMARRREIKHGTA